MTEPTGFDRRYENLKKALTEAETAFEEAFDLKEQIPDIDCTIDRWGKPRYMSAALNPLMTNVEIHGNCGCCRDTPIHTRPYMDYELESFRADKGSPRGTRTIRIYSNPNDFRYSERCPSCYGHTSRVAEETIRGALTQHKIPEAIQDQIVYSTNTCNCAGSTEEESEE